MVIKENVIRYFYNGVTSDFEDQNV